MVGRFRLSALNDELAPTLDEQLDVLAEHGIRAVELRVVLGQNILDLTPAEVATVRNRLRSRGLSVTCLASPIGKARLDEPLSTLLDRFERALRLAEAFAAPNIRLFSYYVSPGEVAAARAEVLSRLGELARRAERAGVTLLHENESGIWGDTPARCLELIEAVGSPALRCLFDPGNFVAVGARPFDEAYPLLAPYIAHVHVKDVRRDPANGRSRAVPAGEGDGQFPELIAALWQGGWDGYLAFEPHLAEAGPSSGYTGPDLFARAVAALRTVVAAAGAEIDVDE